MKEARWAEHGKEKWRAIRFRRGDQIGARQFQDASDPLAFMESGQMHAMPENSQKVRAAMRVLNVKEARRVQAERQALLDARKEFRKRVKDQTRVLGEKGRVEAQPIKQATKRLPKGTRSGLCQLTKPEPTPSRIFSIYHRG